MISIFELFQYGFFVRGLLAGIMIAIIAPVIGIFLVLRRYSLIADTLAHISLAGIALGLLTGMNPLLSALVTAAVGAVGLERIRSSRRISSESALALFLSGSLAVAVVLLSLSNGFTTSLFNYLFGSITTVTRLDLAVIVVVGLVVILATALAFKALVYIAFDEEAAQVSGLPVQSLNTVFIILAALTITLAIPIVGILLISALVVIPVIAAMQFQRPMLQTMLMAQAMAVVAVVGGLLTSFYLDLAPGGTIVLLTIALFGVSALMTKRAS